MASEKEFRCAQPSTKKKKMEGEKLILYVVRFDFKGASLSDFCISNTSTRFWRG